MANLESGPKILLKKKSRFSRESPAKKPAPVEKSPSGNVTSEEDSDESSDPEEYDVDCIIDDEPDEEYFHRFKVRWLGYDSTEDSWVYDNDMDCPDKLNFYWKKHPNKERDYKKRKAILLREQEEQKKAIEQRRLLHQTNQKIRKKNSKLSGRKDFEESRATNFKEEKNLGSRPNLAKQHLSEALAKAEEIKKFRLMKKLEEKKSSVFSDSKSDKKICSSSAEKRKRKVVKKLTYFSSPESSPELAELPHQLKEENSKGKGMVEGKILAGSFPNEREQSWKQLEEDIFGDISDLSSLNEISSDVDLDAEASKTVPLMTSRVDLTVRNRQLRNGAGAGPSTTKTDFFDEIFSSEKIPSSSLVVENLPLQVSESSAEAAAPPPKRVVRQYKPGTKDRDSSDSDSPVRKSKKNFDSNLTKKTFFHQNILESSDSISLPPLTPIYKPLESATENVPKKHVFPTLSTFPTFVSSPVTDSLLRRPVSAVSPVQRSDPSLNSLDTHAVLQSRIRKAELGEKIPQSGSQTGLLLRHVERPRLDPRLFSPVQRQSALDAGLSTEMSVEKSVANPRQVLVSESHSEQLDTSPVVEKILGCVQGANGYRGYLVKFTDRANASHVSDAFMSENYSDVLLSYYIQSLVPSCPTDFFEK